MPFTCPVCDNEEYNEQDGVFYCTECGTQSQEYIVQEVSEQYGFDPGATYHEVSTAKVADCKKPKVSLGRPWTIYEAYQVIILAQTDALISLGASKDLKDVVYTIWANYLSKLGVAFCPKEQIVPEVVLKYKTGRPREIFRGSEKKPSNLRFKNIKESKKEKLERSKRKRSRSEAGIDSDKEIEDPIGPSDSIFLNPITSDSKSYVDARRKARNSPEWMEIKKTIAINFIGIMFTNPDILAYDVVRWVYNGQVPFLSTSHLLPSDMVLSNEDSYLFSVSCFTTKTLKEEVNKLRTFLNLTNIPGPNVTALTFRFTRDLFLPKEFCSFVQQMIKKISSLGSQHTITNVPHEVLAIGYIVLALKIVVGLDDDTEKRLSEYTEELQSLFEFGPKLFNWTEWKKFWMHKLHHQFDSYKELTSNSISNKLEHLDQILETYENMNINKRRFSVTYNLTRLGRQARAFDPEYRNTLAKLLAAASSQDNLTDPGKNSKASSSELTEIESFEERTVSHLVDIKTFQKRLKSHDDVAKCQEILAKVSTRRPKFVHYQFATSESDLLWSRHQNYLWLLELGSRVCGCQVVALDKIVIRLSEFFVLLSEGKSAESVTYSLQGDTVISAEISEYDEGDDLSDFVDD